MCVSVYIPHLYDSACCLVPFSFEAQTKQGIFTRTSRVVNCVIKDCSAAERNKDLEGKDRERGGRVVKGEEEKSQVQLATEQASS